MYRAADAIQAEKTSLWTQDSSWIQDTALFIRAIPAKSLHLAHQYVQLQVSGSSFLWLWG